MNLTLKNSLYLFATIVFLSCSNRPTAEPLQELKRGSYELLFNIGEVDIPINLDVIDKEHWSIRNNDEVITLDSLSWSGKDFHVKMPLFNTVLAGTILTDSTLIGKWTDRSRDSLYEVAFTGHLARRPVMNAAPGDEKIYDATFSPGTPDVSKAVGIFHRHGNELTGTFLTESGDYRFLQGNTSGNSLHLAGFDGAHLFYFCANVDGDSLKDGKFYSGKHWQEDWEARLDSKAKLRNPDSLTTVADKKHDFSFKVRKESGDSILFDKDLFAGKVSIIQIFGSWCPNCTDESIFMKGLYEKYHAQGLEIIPVAFERGNDFESACNSVQHQFAELGLTYPAYYGGASNKGRASEVFSDLSKISSYPTTIFVDKKGVVRKIHTGFYGPGTGELYEEHSLELDEFVQQLLAEETL